MSRTKSVPVEGKGVGGRKTKLGAGKERWRLFGRGSVFLPSRGTTSLTKSQPVSRGGRGVF